MPTESPLLKVRARVSMPMPASLRGRLSLHGALLLWVQDVLRTEPLGHCYFSLWEKVGKEHRLRARCLPVLVLSLLRCAASATLASLSSCFPSGRLFPVWDVVTALGPPLGFRTYSQPLSLRSSIWILHPQSHSTSDLEEMMSVVELERLLIMMSVWLG